MQSLTKIEKLFTIRVILHFLSLPKSILEITKLQHTETKTLKKT